MKVKAWKLLGLMFAVIFALSAVRVVYAIGVVATINVQSGPQGVAYDYGKSEIFATTGGLNTVVVISDSTSVPEFGSAALFMVMVFAISAVILASKKLKRPRSCSF